MKVFDSVSILTGDCFGIVKMTTATSLVVGNGDVPYMWVDRDTARRIADLSDKVRIDGYKVRDDHSTVVYSPFIPDHVTHYSLSDIKVGFNAY